MDILYEDNHIIIVNKSCTEIVQGDKTGDKPLSEMVQAYLKEKYAKPGNVFIGVTHRLDRPVSGLVVFAKTSKALSRLNEMFRTHNLTKRYWAIVKNRPPQNEEVLTHYLVRNERMNKTFVHDKQVKDSKRSKLSYKIIARSDKYYLLEIDLMTGRHHQIRAQLAHIGCPIRGDLKYGFERSNKDGGISLHARNIQFIHPVSQKEINVVAPTPDDTLWKTFEEILGAKGEENPAAPNTTDNHEA